jgi:hypothetical protein
MKLRKVPPPAREGMAEGKGFREERDLIFDEFTAIIRRRLP